MSIGIIDFALLLEPSKRESRQISWYVFLLVLTSISPSAKRPPYVQPGAFLVPVSETRRLPICHILIVVRHQLYLVDHVHHTRRIMIGI